MSCIYHVMCHIMLPCYAKLMEAISCHCGFVETDVCTEGQGLQSVCALDVQVKPPLALCNLRPAAQQLVLCAATYCQA